MLDVLRHPAHLLVGGGENITKTGDAHEPGWHGAIDEGLVRAIAVWIAVDDGGAFVDGAVGLQVANDVRVRFLDELASEIAHCVGKVAAHGYRASESIDASGLQHAQIVFAEGGCLMHQARAFVGGNVVVRHYYERAALALLLEVVEQRPIAAANQLGAFHMRFHR